MAERVFEIRTEPHVARVGGHVFEFEPEAIGAEFVTAYTELQRVQAEASDKLTPRKASSTKHAKAAEADLSVVAELEAAMRGFLSGLMVPASRERFAEARIPQRVLISMIEWTAELYGGGSGNPDAVTGTSSD